MILAAINTDFIDGLAVGFGATVSVIVLVHFFIVTRRTMPHMGHPPRMYNPPEPPPKPVKRYWWESVHQMD